MSDIVDRLRDLAPVTNAETRAAMEEVAAEIKRLRAGGCARDQGVTQYCAEAAKLAAENERLRAVVQKAAQLAEVATDWHLPEVEIDGKMVSTYDLHDEFLARLRPRRAGGEVMSNLVEEAIREHWGERCPDFDPGCLGCLAWKMVDELTSLRTENEALLAANRDVMLHWDALKADYEKLLSVIPECRRAARAAWGSHGDAFITIALEEGRT